MLQEHALSSLELVNPAQGCNGAALPPTICERLRRRATEWFRQEALTEPPADLAEPFTLPWFLALEYHRYHRQARWLTQALEFAEHDGETVLALGRGLGSDGVQYARHGARVIVCNPDADELEATRHHFALRALPAVFHHTPRPNLPWPSASIDLACVIQMVADLVAASDWLAELHRLLKPGGKLLMLESLPSYSYWAGQRVIRRLLPRLSIFEEVKIRRRHLRRSELGWLWRWWPRPWLERCFGRFLLVKAHKPIHQVHQALPLAA
ncbi:hypothetical protein HRbin36_00251 [bacterium HR36]|nr:hypothetical protein HRbin36_00251 [bacterium HR36]